MQRAVSDFGLECSFQQAAKRVQEHYGFALPLSALATQSRRHAQGIANKQKARSGAHLLRAKGAEKLEAEADGSFLRIVSTQSNGADRRKSRQVCFQEARLCAAREHGSDRVCYEATFEPVDNIAALWSFAAQAAGMAINTKVHILSDGATWIHRQGRIAFGAQGNHLIDLYHVLEYMHEAVASCSQTPKRWLKTQKKRLKNGRADKVIDELQKHLEPQNWPDEQCPVRRAWRYLDNRRDCLAYDRAIAQELPLGSGLIESGNKHVLQARLKIPGASWNINTAENFVTARALRANGGWNNYWKDAAKTAA